MDIKWHHFFAVFGIVCAGIIIIYIIYRILKENPDSSLEVYETKTLETDDLVDWAQGNRSTHPLSVYLIYGNNGRLAGGTGQYAAQILEYMKQNTKVLSRFDDFIVQLLFNEYTCTVEKYRVITFEHVARDLNNIFEANHFYNAGIIKLE